MIHMTGEPADERDPGPVDRLLLVFVVGVAVSRRTTSLDGAG